MDLYIFSLCAKVIPDRSFSYANNSGGKVMPKLCSVGPWTVALALKDDVQRQRLISKFDRIITAPFDPNLGEIDTEVRLSDDEKVAFMLWKESCAEHDNLFALYGEMADIAPSEWFRVQRDIDMRFCILMQFLTEKYPKATEYVLDKGRILSVRKGGALVTNEMRTGDTREHPGKLYQILPVMDD